jgi:predicted metal-dependent hydrolase
MLSSLFRSAPPPPLDDVRALPLPDGSHIDVRWVRDARARRLRLLVNDRGVRLTLPPRASERSAHAFLLEQRDWLARTLARRPPPAEHAALSRGLTTVVPLRDVEVPLRWQEGRFANVALDDAGLVLQLPARAGDAAARRALRDFYVAQARADIGRWLPKYVPTLPATPASLGVRPLASLWGSLGPRNDLLLDLSLVLGRPSAFEYVLVHELCHLHERNHSRRFWRHVEAHCPDWRDERKYLHGEGLALKGRLKALVVGAA